MPVARLIVLQNSPGDEPSCLSYKNSGDYTITAMIVKGKCLVAPQIGDIALCAVVRECKLLMPGIPELRVLYFLQKLGTKMTSTV